MDLSIGTLAGKVALEDSASASLKVFQSNLRDIGTGFSRAGSVLSVGITAPLVAAAGASIYFSSSFEASMTKLVSLAGVGSGELEGVKQHILALAPAVGIGPQALAEAMTKVSSTVSDTKVALEILDMAAKGSAAGMGTALDVAGALTAIVNSYGKENITAAQAADILTKAVQDGGAEAKELAPTLANVVPMAAQLGISFQEVAANIATFTKLGVPATEAVTSLSAVMTALLKETKQGGDALASIGMNYAELRKEIKDRGLAQTMAELNTKFGDNKSLLADVFGRVEALRNVMGTAGQQAATYATEINRMNGAAKEGTALSQAFEAMQGKQLQTWAQVSAAAQVLAIKFGDSLAPAVVSVMKVAVPLLDKVSALADWFGKLPQPVQTTAIALAGIAAAAGPVLYVVGGIATAAGTLVPILTLLGLTAPVAAAGTASVALAGAAAAPALAATGVGATAASTGIGALMLAALPVVAVLAGIAAAATIAYQAWQLWNESQARGKEEAAQTIADQKTMAMAAQHAGHEFKDLASASTFLAGEIAALNKDTLDNAAAAKVAAGATKEQKDEIAAATVVTEAHKTAVTDMKLSITAAIDAANISREAFASQSLAIKLTAEAAAIYIPALDKIAESGRALTEQEKSYYETITTSRVNTDLERVALLQLNEVTLTRIEELRAHGLSEAEIARKLDTTTAALKAYADQEKQWRDQSRQLSDNELKMSGTAHELVMKHNKEEFEDKISKLDKTNVAHMTLYDQLAKLRKQADEMDGSSWATLSQNTQKAKVERMEAAREDLRLMIENGTFSREDIDAQRAKYEELRDTVRGYGADARAAQRSAAAEAKSHNDKLLEQKKILDDLAKKNREMGNSIDYSKPGGQGQDPVVVKFLHDGWSLAQAVQLAFQSRGGAVNPNDPLWQTKGPRVPGYKEGGPSGAGGPSMLHPNEYVVPSGGALVMRESTQLVERPVRVVIQRDDSRLAGNGGPAVVIQNLNQTITGAGSQTLARQVKDELMKEIKLTTQLGMR